MSAKRRLTDADVLWLRKNAKRYRSGWRIPYADLARVVGCSATHARDIILGRRRACSSTTGVRK